MVKFIAVVFCVVSMMGLGYAQHGVPREVIRFAEDYIKDSENHSFGKRVGIVNDPTVELQDLRVGRAIEVYTLKKNISIDAYPDTVDFSEIIESSGHWFVLIMAHNKPLYPLTVNYSTGNAIFAGRSSLGSGIMWKLLSENYPESTGINPIYFSRFGYLDGGYESFLYFKQKGPRKIYHLSARFSEEGDSLRAQFTGSIKTLDDSRKLVGYWKKQNRTPKKPEPTARELYERIRAQETGNGGQK